MQKAHKAVQTGQYLRSLHRSIGQSMEIRVHSRLILARYKGCTNARCILSRSNRHEEFRNENPFSVQKTHKAVQAGQYHRSMHRSIVHSMEIRVHSQLILARYKGCTNARFILSRSYGHEEFKNANPFWVQKTHKAVQAGQYHRSQHRSTVPSIIIIIIIIIIFDKHTKFRCNGKSRFSRLILPRFKGCTHARCILSR